MMKLQFVSYLKQTGLTAEPNPFVRLMGSFMLKV